MAPTGFKVRADNESVFKSKSVQEFSKRHNIHWEFFIPYTNKNVNLSEMANSLLTLYLTTMIEKDTFADKLIKIAQVHNLTKKEYLDNFSPAELMYGRTQPVEVLMYGPKTSNNSKALIINFEAIMEMFAALQVTLQRTEDHFEAVDAFFEKRQPIFKGK